VPAGVATHDVTVDRPAPGTPPDSLYALPTAPSASFPYAFDVPNASYALPLTVFRPFFEPVAAQTGKEATPLEFAVSATDPAPGVALAYSARGLPAGATFDPVSRAFRWTPKYGQAGHYMVQVVADDGVIPVVKDVAVSIAEGIRGDVNGDAVVSCADLSAASAAVGRRDGQVGYMPTADVDGNGVVDIRDIAAISRLLPVGTHC
jgi:hypothetical protein